VFAAQFPHISLDTYLARERERADKHEYLDGLVYMMAGAGERHGSIVSNTHGLLWSQLGRRPCRSYVADLRVKTPNGLVAYPALVVVCGKPELLDNKGDVRLNPTLIIEVLSLSTAGCDGTIKAIHYRSLPTLQTYVLIAQERPRIEVFERGQAEDWQGTYEIDMQGWVALPSIECTLALADVYANVEF
jgi:Uma2 family endonuclease